MARSTMLAVGAVVVGLLYAVSRSSAAVTRVEQGLDRDVSGRNEPAGLDASRFADRISQLSDSVDEQVRNEERFAGVPVSPYQ
jgi:hypothetical protein